LSTEPGSPPAEAAAAPLTQAELALVALLGSGHPVPEIASLLQVSTHTVEKRKRRIYTKLGVDHQSHAVSRAVERGPLGVAAPPRAALSRDRAVLVAGRPGPGVDLVARTLADAGIPVLPAPRTGARPAPDRTARHLPGPCVVVLVDPQPADWQAAAGRSAPTVAVLTHPPCLRVTADALLRGALSVLTMDGVPDCLAPIVTLAARGFASLDAPLVHELLACAAPSLLSGGPGSGPGGPDRPGGTDRQGGSNGSGGPSKPGRPMGAGQPAVATPPQLTGRELDILRSIAAGHSVRQTGRALGIAVKTVENTQTRLFQKLGARNRAQALAVGSRYGLLEGGAGCCDPLTEPPAG
jgi:DNA-binding CsgD family transcriptional regulator